MDVGSIRKLRVESHQSSVIDLPESCLAAILCLTSPRDVARMACVSRAFRDASHSDLVWERMLPSFYREIMAQVPNAPPATCSKKEVYNYLCNRVFFQNGSRDIWIDRGTGGMCHGIGARALNITWGDDDSYWEWINRENSRFAEVACLKHVWWFELWGNLQSPFPPGRYTLSWRVGLMSDHVAALMRVPIIFKMETSNHQVCHLELYLAPEGKVPSRLELKNYQELPIGAWTEIDVGQFTVEAGEPTLEIRFTMFETVGLLLKSSICVDGVLIRPTHVLRAEIPA